jgi:hypothetical protein
VTRRRSTYNLDTAFNYLRLAYQSMSRDQDEARRMISMIVKPDASLTVKDRLRGLAYVVAKKTKELDEEVEP